jgi:prepilin-type N-terminal cleavage/methylation domain-containing protein
MVVFVFVFVIIIILIIKVYYYILMNNFKKVIFSNKKGFTLIELLVVVAIIAILVSVVLISLSDARKRGNDAGVKSNLNTIRGVSELFYSNNGNSFGSTLVLGECPAHDVSATNMIQKDKTIADAITEAKKNGNGVAHCYSSSAKWSVAVGLKYGANTSWCIDSGGASKELNFSPDSAINSTTFSCN